MITAKAKSEFVATKPSRPSGSGNTADVTELVIQRTAEQDANRSPGRPHFFAIG